MTGGNTGVPRSPNRFREGELKRVLRAAKAEGAASVEVDPTTGKIAVVIGRPPTTTTANSWDEVLIDDADAKRPA